jgi:hypothetical protein
VTCPLYPTGKTTVSDKTEKSLAILDPSIEKSVWYRFSLGTEH